jgi:hypothetical protein
VWWGIAGLAATYLLVRRKREPRWFALPYPTARVYGTFGDCRSGGRQHKGLDLGGVGPDHGLGTPVRALTFCEVTDIVRPEDNSARWGRRDTRSGTVTRRGVTLPRAKQIPGYGLVRFHTLDHGSAHTGTMITTVGTAGPLEGHRIRYMHLADPLPSLRVGSLLAPGDELGLMGGTAIMESLPHVHIDIESPAGDRVDVASFVGLAPDLSRC